MQSSENTDDEDDSTSFTEFRKRKRRVNQMDPTSSKKVPPSIASDPKLNLSQPIIKLTKLPKQKKQETANVSTEINTSTNTNAQSQNT